MNNIEPTEEEKKAIDSALRWKLTSMLIAALFGGFVFAKKIDTKSRIDYSPPPTSHWTKNGANAPVRAMNSMKVIHIKVTPTVANGGSIDITDCGLSSVVNASIMAKRNNTNAYDVPQVSLKTVSNTSITYNIVQGSNTLVSVLGLSVLQGPSTIFATDLSNIELYAMVIGY